MNSEARQLAEGSVRAAQMRDRLLMGAGSMWLSGGVACVGQEE